MSATIILAKEIITDRIIHIENVNKAKKELFECCGCRQKLSAVKTEARGKDWHFRHLQDANIIKCRSQALHDYAVQILFDNTEIQLTSELKINYSAPQKEAWINNKYRSDVMVNYMTNELHFEVFVTHDLTSDKIDEYRNNKIKCVKIDLSDSELLTASPEIIKTEVLGKYKNKELIYWTEQQLPLVPVKQEIHIYSEPVSQVENKSTSSFDWDAILSWALVAIVAFIGLNWLTENLSNKRKRRYL